LQSTAPFSHRPAPAARPALPLPLGPSHAVRARQREPRCQSPHPLPTNNRDPKMLTQRAASARAQRSHVHTQEMMESDQDHKCMPFSVECCQQKSARPPQHPKPMEAAQCDCRLSVCDCALHSMSMRPWQWKRKRRDAGQDAGLAPASMPHGTPAAIRAQQHRHPSHAGRRAQESRDQTQQGAGKVRVCEREERARRS